MERACLEKDERREMEGEEGVPPKVRQQMGHREREPFSVNFSAKYFLWKTLRV